MAMTLAEALEAVERGETQEEYEKRKKKLRRLSNERFDLEDKIDCLKNDPNPEKYAERIVKAENRLQKVLKQIRDLQ